MQELKKRGRSFKDIPNTNLPTILINGKDLLSLKLGKLKYEDVTNNELKRYV